MHLFDDSQQDSGERFADRVMAAELNLAIQRGDQQDAMQTGALLFGQWLQNQAS